jgi:TP901 family phage tail tape measure protein
MSKQGGIKAGAAYVELSMRDSVTEPLRRAEKRMELFGEKVKEIGSAVAMAGAAVAAFGGAIVGAAAASVAAFAKIAGDFSDLAAQTGLTVELMSELETSLKDAGSSAEEFAKSVVKMRRFISEAADGSKGAAEALGKLGLSASDLINLSADDQFLKIADALSKVKNPTDRLALAMELFGKSAYKMLPVLEAGGAGIEEFRRKAREMGFSLSGETADAADALGTQIEVLQDQFGRIAVAIGEALLPVAEAFVAVMQGLVGRVIEFIRENQGLVLGVTAAGVALLAAGTAIGIVGALLVGFGAVISGTATVLGALAAASSFVAAAVAGIVPAAIAAWTALTGPVALVIAGVVAVGVAIAYVTGLLSQMGASFTALWDTALGFTSTLRDAWAGVTDAIAAGDFALAGEIAIKGLEAAMIRGFANIMQQVVMPFVQKVADLLAKIPGLGGLSQLAGAYSAASGVLGIDAARADKELEDLREKARKLRKENESTRREMAPGEFTSPTAPTSPAVPEIAAPALPDLAPAQAEIQARMSAMGGFNAAALGGMFGGADEMVAQQKRGNDYLAKLLEQGKRNRDSLVWA